MTNVDALATAAAEQSATEDEASRKRKAVDYTVRSFGKQMPKSDPRKPPTRTKPSPLAEAIKVVIADVLSGEKRPDEFYGIGHYQSLIGAAGALNRFRKTQDPEDKSYNPARVLSFDGALVLETARVNGESFLGAKFIPEGWDEDDESTWDTRQADASQTDTADADADEDVADEDVE